jgi:hypothetical protein
MRNLITLSLILCALISQTQTTVNAYAKVTSVTGSSVLALSNVNISNHTFTVGGQVVIMQMQDNVIGTNTTNASTFGNLSSIASAGLYEIRTIAAVTPTSGTPTSLTLSATLANTYNFNTNSSVQLISFRDLGVNYTTSANISGPAWNGNVGGVIAFYVTNTLTLNHRIIADGLGFRGGSYSSNASGDFACVNTSYTSTLTTLGAKGEGIYLATVTSFSTGRGKILNGGGGGSENNAGGGGGGNYTAGGDGGLGYPCTLANSGRGLGGISLSGQISASRIFMGGGGGGGQANNGLSTFGGNGGGIILIKAGTIATSTTCGSSIQISANGVTAGNSGNDGAGGGGAGGSIIIEATTFTATATCPLTLMSNAGNGGSVGNGASHGGGAGGGQGVVIYSIAQPTTNITTQTNNGTPGSDNSGGTTNATGGGGSSNGGIIASGSGPLPITLVFFKAEPLSGIIKLNWQTASEKNNKVFEIEKSADGINFIKIGTVNGAMNSSTLKNYEFNDTEPRIGFDYYRLKQVDVDGAFAYSPIVYIDIDDILSFSFYPNPLGGGDILSIHLEKHPGGPVEVMIYDMTGKQFFSNDLMPEHIDQPEEIEIKNLNLDAGVYLLKVQSTYSTLIKKLLVK